MNRSIASQNAMIQAHFERGGTLTPSDALNLYGSFRLAARVYDLKKQGYPIMKTMVDVGQGRKVARYSKDYR